ncbi:MAG: hypothetical protein GY928_34900 [Colwellia sp.]|nr:hypothetical protein [Colwellia sp.]
MKKNNNSIIITNPEKRSILMKLRDSLIMLFTWGGWLFLLMQVYSLQGSHAENNLPWSKLFELGTILAALLVTIPLIFLLYHLWVRIHW